MSLRPYIAADQTEIRQSRKIATVAAALEMDESQVRELIDAGELEAHGVGKRGVRVYLDSVAAYQDARNKAPRGRNTTVPRQRARVSHAASKASQEALRKSGILP